MKKRIVLLAAAAGLLLAGCGGPPGLTAGVFLGGESDLAYVQEKGTLVIGVTDFAPMDYREDGAWEGFDAQMAETFAKSIGVTPEFQEIDWDQKTELLNSGEIDCIWNGMTMTGELMKQIDCSDPYLFNSQVIVMPKADLDRYGTAESCQHMLFAVESGSAGESVLSGMNYRYTAYDTQKEALQSAADGKTDAAVIDIIMAGHYTKEGNEFDHLGFRILLNDEEICVGLRKGSDLTEKVNTFLKESISDDTMSETAAQYGIDDAVIK